MLHAQTFNQSVLILGGEQTLALHFVFGRQPEGEHRRRRTVGLGPVDSSLDDGPVADVDAVEESHRNGRAVCLAQRKWGQL